MKKNNLFQDTLEREIQDLLAPYPDPMGRTDFRKACRIGTRTSIYLLQSGLVPCENTGKQTRCYKIAKSDVAAYLRRRLTEPEYYTPPSGWYKNYPAHKPPAFSLWCTEGRLKAFPYQHSYKVPKEWLLEFLTSEDYNSITRKSKEHYAMIAAVRTKKRGRKPKAGERQ